jgi:hypothetical protein
VIAAPVNLFGRDSSGWFKFPSKISGLIADGDLARLNPLGIRQGNRGSFAPGLRWGFFR